MRSSLRGAPFDLRTLVRTRGRDVPAEIAENPRNRRRRGRHFLVVTADKIAARIAFLDATGIQLFHVDEVRLYLGR